MKSFESLDHAKDFFRVHMNVSHEFRCTDPDMKALILSSFMAGAAAVLSHVGNMIECGASKKEIRATVRAWLDAAQDDAIRNLRDRP